MRTWTCSKKEGGYGLYGSALDTANDRAVRVPEEPRVRAHKSIDGDVCRSRVRNDRALDIRADPVTARRRNLLTELCTVDVQIPFFIAYTLRTIEL